MVKKKTFYSILIALCFFALTSFTLTFGVSASAFADEKDFSIVFDDYDGQDMTVSLYEKVTIPTATFSERGVRIGKAETYVYDGEQNLVAPYRKGDYLFTETGEYSVVLRPIGYATKGVDGGSKNLSFKITVTDGEMPETLIFPQDDNLAEGLLCDFDEEFYLSDAFLDYGKASIYLSEFPQVFLEEVSDGNNAIKLVKNSGYAKAGLYFGAKITEEITDLSFVFVKLKTDATEVYFDNLSGTAFYKMGDLSKMTLGEFVYGKDDYQTVLISAKALALDKNSDGIQLVFGGANGAFVSIDEIGFITERKDYKFITSLTTSSVVETDSLVIDINAYFNGIKISSPVCDFTIPDEYASFASVTFSDGKFFFNALKHGDAVLRVNYYENDEFVVSADLDIHIKSVVEATGELAYTLGENELVNWSTEKYKYAVQKSTVSGYTADFFTGTKVNVGYNTRYYNGSYGAATVIFPERKVYSDGYVKINCIFDGYNASRAVKIYKYGETDPANVIVTFKADVGNVYYNWYVPVSVLTDENGVLNGIQVVNTANWMNLGKINYVSEDDYVPNYVIYDNVSELALYENGESHTVSVYLERDGYSLDNSDYFIELQSSNPSSLSVDGFAITPLVAGDAVLTISYYKDSTKTVIIAQKEIAITVDTVVNVLSATLSEGQLVNWDHILYGELVSDTTVVGRSMSAETYESYVNPNKPHSGYFFDFVPAGGNGSGRTIIFPVQNVYTDGYVKIRLTAQSGLFQAWTFVEIYKIGETSALNYVLKATGTDALADQTSVDFYVPVTALTDGNGVLTGVQILAAGTGWLRIEMIEYVGSDDYTPTYSVSDNLSEISVAEGGGAQTVTATVLINGMTLGNFFEYSLTLASDNDAVAAVSGAQIIPVSSGTANITLTVKDGAGNTIAIDVRQIEVRPLSETLAATLGENELVNWASDLQLEFLEGAVVNGYTGTLTNTQINRVAAGYYNYQFNSSDSSTGRVQIEFAEKKAYAEGYVKIGLLLQSGWGQTSYVYKYGETANGACVYSFTTPSADKNKIIYHYIPVADLVNSEGILEGIQVVLTLGGSYGQIYDISYVTELPA